MKKIITPLIVILLLGCNKKVEYPFLDQYIHELSKNDKSSGILVVAEKGNIIYQNSFGFANREKKEPINHNTKFVIASVTKQFTAMGIVLLQRQGKLNFNDSVTKFLGKSTSLDSIRVIDLVNHSSGLPDLYGNGALIDLMKLNNSPTNNEIVNYLINNQVKKSFPVSTNYEYSNTNYALLASIIEIASGISYSEYLNENIFKPLGMNNSSIISKSTKPVSFNTTGYTYSNSLKTILPANESPEFSNFNKSGSKIYGDGSMVSTVLDLLKWDQALYGNFLSDKEKNMIFNSSTSTQNKQVYSFGWEIELDSIYGKIAHHSGNWPGWNANIERHLDKNKTIIYLNNLSGKEYNYPDFIKVRQITYNNYYNLDASNINRYVGAYEADNGAKDTLIAKENRLFKLYRGYELELIARSKTNFELKGFSPIVRYKFTFNENDEVTNSRITQKERGVDRKFKKIRN